MSQQERDKLISLVLRQLLNDLTIGSIEDIVSLLETVPTERLKNYLGKGESE